MPKRKKKIENSYLCPSNKQTSLSKYFYSSNAKMSDYGKQLNSDAVECLQKIPDACTISQEVYNVEQKDVNSSEMDFDNEIGLKNDRTTKTVNISNSKLSHFKFNKQFKSTENSSRIASKLMEYDQPTCNSLDFSSFEDMDSEETAYSQNSTKTASPLKKVEKYTPLEKQYLEFQAKYPDAVLLIECGYKYRFFGKDAKIAQQDLNIGCYQYHSFLSASIPVHRLHYHVRRLVLKGHKVGVIKQTESTALKAASETRNELFNRELYCMYSKSTFIEDELFALNDENTVEMDDFDDVSGYLVCINENKSSKTQSDKSVINIACVALQVSSGDIFYSSFQENLFQNELECFLLCINPSEILLPSSQLSKETENFIKSFICDRSVRIERLDYKSFDHSSALSSMTSFISSQEDMHENLQILLSLPSSVISCLSALKIYLTNFKVENVLKNIKNMQSFSSVDHMVLNAATIRSLEIIKSSSNSTNHGTLLWCLNQTLTKFGERLLKSWIVKPLKNFQIIEERLDIVTEIIHSDSIIFKRLSSVLYKLPDLEKLLCLAFYQKCSCNDFLKLVKALVNVKSELVRLSDRISTEIKVTKLKQTLLIILKNLENIERFHSNIDSVAAKEGNKIQLFLDTSQYTSLENCKSKIYDVEKKLSDLRPGICKILRLPAFKYTTVAGQKYLIEVPNSHLSLVPDEWLKISVTKQVSRFRSPEVIELCKQLDQEQERLLEFANEAWEEFLIEFGQEFYKHKCAISYLAQLDVYMALAKASKDQNFCRPLFVSDGLKFDVKQGRHPVVVKLMGEENQFVANDVNLNDVERCLIVTGPNMGGKSTYIRQIALIALMAHIGCFVPADSATIPLLDGIYVRMGADDDLVNKMSTFMSEMSEASGILSCATSKSLVIFDELGRGTSTNDGASIASATLNYLIRNIKCLILFVTHYPTVLELKKYYPANILTVHMAYILKELDDGDDIQTVTFLYNVVSGISEKSYGINVAALAGISKDILSEAATKSKEMQLKMIIQRQLQKLLQKLDPLNLNKLISMDCIS